MGAVGSTQERLTGGAPSKGPQRPGPWSQPTCLGQNPRTGQQRSSLDLLVLNKVLDSGNGHRSHRAQCEAGLSGTNPTVVRHDPRPRRGPALSHTDGEGADHGLGPAAEPSPC